MLAAVVFLVINKFIKGIVVIDCNFISLGNSCFGGKCLNLVREITSYYLGIRLTAVVKKTACIA